MDDSVLLRWQFCPGESTVKRVAECLEEIVKLILKFIRKSKGPRTAKQS